MQCVLLQHLRGPLPSRVLGRNNSVRYNREAIRDRSCKTAIEPPRAADGDGIPDREHTLSVDG